MYVGAGISALGVVMPFMMRDEYREIIAETMAETGDTGINIDTMVSLSLISAAVMGLIAVALWIFNAVFNKRGAAWARILSSVLGGISVISGLWSFTQPQPVLVTGLNILGIVLAAVILYFLWRPESSRFYEAVSDAKLRR